MNYEKIFFLSAFILVYSLSQSQTISVNSGVIISNLYVTTKGNAQESWLKNYKSKIGYSFGVSVNFETQKEGISIETGIQYANLGAVFNLLDNIKDNGIDPILNIGDETLKLNYVTTPILIKFKLNEKLNFKIGPQVGYLFSNKYKSDSDFTSSRKLSGKKLDFGVNAGLGYSVNSKVGLSLNIYNGFGKVEKIECFGCSDNSEANSKNRYASLSVYYVLKN